MSDTSSQSAATIDANEIWQRYLEREAARDALFERLRPANQTAIFDALASAGVVTLVVNFDGFGDSGQIEAMTATGAEGEIALPETCIPYASPGRDDGDDAIDQQPLTLAEAIETLCYDLLRQTHAGWENNDGAFGDFTFDVTMLSPELPPKMLSIVSRLDWYIRMSSLAPDTDSRPSNISRSSGPGSAAGKRNRSPRRSVQ